MTLDPFLAPVHLLEVAHVAHRLSVSVEHVRRLIRSHQLAAVRFGRRWRIEAQELQAYIDAHRVPRQDLPAVPHRGRDGPRESTVRALPHAVNR